MYVAWCRKPMDLRKEAMGTQQRFVDNQWRTHHVRAHDHAMSCHEFSSHPRYMSTHTMRRGCVYVCAGCLSATQHQHKRICPLPHHHTVTFGLTCGIWTLTTRPGATTVCLYALLPTLQATCNSSQLVVKQATSTDATHLAWALSGEVPCTAIECFISRL